MISFSFVRNAIYKGSAIPPNALKALSTLGEIQLMCAGSKATVLFVGLVYIINVLSIFLS